MKKKNSKPKKTRNMGFKTYQENVKDCYKDPELCARKLSHCKCENSFKGKDKKECDHGVYLGKVLELD